MFIKHCPGKLTDELLEKSVALPLEDLGEDDGCEAATELDQPQQHQHHSLRRRQVHPGPGDGRCQQNFTVIFTIFSY